MGTNETEALVRKAFSRTVSDGLLADRLTRSVARSISYDPALREVGERELEKALLSAEGETEHSAVLAKIREYQQKTRQRLDAGAPGAVSDDIVNRGFFLQCWKAFLRDGDLCAVRPLTVSFLAKRLAKDKKYIGDDELDWCAREAVRETEDLCTEEKSRRQQAAYEENTVLLVMHKFRRSMESNPEKTQALLDAWERDYTEYSVKQFGHEPDWSPSGFTRQPATHAFDKTKKNG